MQPVARRAIGLRCIFGRSGRDLVFATGSTAVGDHPEAERGVL